MQGVGDPSSGASRLVVGGIDGHFPYDGNVKRPLWLSRSTMPKSGSMTGRPQRKRRSYGGREVLRFGEAIAALAIAGLAVRLLPFKDLTRTLGWGGRGGRRPGTAESLHSETAQAVWRASRRVPWRTVCIHRGLAAQWMLRRRGLDSRFHYGLSQAGSILSAHVWVSLDGSIVVGEEEAARFTCVAEFPPKTEDRTLTEA